MRKIEKLMCDAIASNADYWRLNNTEIRRQLAGRHRVYLHNNHIATVSTDPACPFVQVFDGGWQTVTTKSRLNALLDRFTDPTRNGVFQRNWEWFVRDDRTGTVAPFYNGYTFDGTF